MPYFLVRHFYFIKAITNKKAIHKNERLFKI